MRLITQIVFAMLLMCTCAMGAESPPDRREASRKSFLDIDRIELVNDDPLAGNGDQILNPGEGSKPGHRLHMRIYLKIRYSRITYYEVKVEFNDNHGILAAAANTNSLRSYIWYEETGHWDKGEIIVKDCWIRVIRSNTDRSDLEVKLDDIRVKYRGERRKGKDKYEEVEVDLSNPFDPPESEEELYPISPVITEFVADDEDGEIKFKVHKGARTDYCFGWYRHRNRTWTRLNEKVSRSNGILKIENLSPGTYYIKSIGHNKYGTATSQIETVVLGTPTDPDEVLDESPQLEYIGGNRIHVRNYPGRNVIVKYHIYSRNRHGDWQLNCITEEKSEFYTLSSNYDLQSDEVKVEAFFMFKGETTPKSETEIGHKVRITKYAPDVVPVLEGLYGTEILTCLYSNDPHYVLIHNNTYYYAGKQFFNRDAFMDYLAEAADDKVTSITFHEYIPHENAIVLSVSLRDKSFFEGDTWFWMEGVVLGVTDTHDDLDPDEYENFALAGAGLGFTGADTALDLTALIGNSVLAVVDGVCYLVDMDDESKFQEFKSHSTKAGIYIIPTLIPFVSGSWFTKGKSVKKVVSFRIGAPGMLHLKNKGIKVVRYLKWDEAIEMFNRIGPRFDDALRGTLRYVGAKSDDIAEIVRRAERFGEVGKNLLLRDDIVIALTKLDRREQDAALDVIELLSNTATTNNKVLNREFQMAFSLDNIKIDRLRLIAANKAKGVLGKWHEQKVSAILDGAGLVPVKVRDGFGNFVDLQHLHVYRNKNPLDAEKYGFMPDGFKKMTSSDPVMKAKLRAFKNKFDTGNPLTEIDDMRWSPDGDRVLSIQASDLGDLGESLSHVNRQHALVWNSDGDDIFEFLRQSGYIRSKTTPEQVSWAADTIKISNNRLAKLNHQLKCSVQLATLPSDYRPSPYNHITVFRSHVYIDVDESPSMGQISGRVVKNHLPFSGCWVDLFEDNTDRWVANVCTNANGEYKFENLDPSKTYQVVPYDHIGVDHHAISLSSISLNDGDTVLPISFCHIGGMIKIGGNPTANVWVDLFDHSGLWVGHAKTGADGRFLLPCVLGHNGSYRVSAYHPIDKSQIDYPHHITLENNNVLNVNFNLNQVKRYTVNGRVTEGNQPYQNAWIDIFSTRGTWICNTQTDNNGNYSLGPILPGRYYLKLYKKNTLEPINYPSSIEIHNSNVSNINFDLPSSSRQNRPPSVLRVNINQTTDNDFGRYVYATYTLTAIANDPDGDRITEYKWMYADGKEFYDSNKATIVYSHQNWTSNTFSRLFKLSVKDEHGEWSPIPTEFLLTFRGIGR